MKNKLIKYVAGLLVMAMAISSCAKNWTYTLLMTPRRKAYATAAGYKSVLAKFMEH
ncbi:MAG: hypothetical protein R2765_11210 [Ferruginibacter sp.]